jgi:hypothetical protein
VKFSKAQIHSRVYKLPELRFEDQRLTSFSGTVVLQALFKTMDIHGKLQRCFAHMQKGSVVGFHTVALLMILHLMVGYRRLRDIDRYRDDPLVRRALGLRRLPHVCTVSRVLCRADRRSITKLQQFNRDLVLQRLSSQSLPRLTLDFDGSVISSGRYAEGTAIGYNDKKKGARSYYPLFCTVAQTSQVLDAYHRAGNVHDSNGSIAFIGSCIAQLRAHLPGVIVESRQDSAFFSDETVSFLDSQRVEFSISVPFERFSELKQIIESGGTWRRLDSEWSYFELPWSPSCWSKRYRFLFLRHKVKKQRKGPVQLELFVPHEDGYEFKVIVTNKQGKANRILMFHNGRASQEKVFAELKGQCQMDYIPVRRLAGNQWYFLSAVIAHNLFRELQMKTSARDRATSAKRSSLWTFLEATTIRQRLIHRAGRLTRPQGALRLTLSGNKTTQQEFQAYMKALGALA